MGRNQKAAEDERMKRTSSYRDDLLADLQDPEYAALYLEACREDSEEMHQVALRDVAEAATYRTGESARKP